MGSEVPLGIYPTATRFPALWLGPQVFNSCFFLKETQLQRCKQEEIVPLSRMGQKWGKYPKSVPDSGCRGVVCLAGKCLLVRGFCLERFCRAAILLLCH